MADVVLPDAVATGGALAPATTGVAPRRPPRPLWQGLDLERAVASAAAITRAEYEQAPTEFLPRLQALYAAHLSENGLAATVFPTTVLQAPPDRGGSDGRAQGGAGPPFTTYIRNTDADAAAGIPGLSLLAGLTCSGLPVGIELDGPAGSDAILSGHRPVAGAERLSTAAGAENRPPREPTPGQPGAPRLRRVTGREGAPSPRR